MKIYYKFMSAKDFSTIECGGPFISVGSLKHLIFESKYQAKKSTGDPRADCPGHNGRSLCLGTDLDLQVTNAQTNEDYVNDSVMIVANSSVLVRRVPGNRRRRPIDTTTIVAEPLEVEKSLASGSSGSGSGTGTSVLTDAVKDDDLWGHDFGEDLFALPGAAQVKSNHVPAAGAVCAGGVGPEENEDSKIIALVGTPALGYYASGSNKVVSSGKWMGGRGFDGMEGRTPPEGYVCRRCNIAGHFIQHCPTNGDPKYDFKRVRPPRGIPKSMLVANPDGSYKLPAGDSAVLKPNEVAFDREMEGLSSSSHSASTRSIPPELHCPLCKHVMKDAVLTSRCCFDSFCDKCIRDHLVNTKLKCVCGKSNVLSDYLIPNLTLREAIKRILESGSCSSSGDNISSTPRVQEMDSARHQSANANAPVADLSVMPSTERKRVSPAGGDSDQVAKKPKSAGAADVSEARRGPADVKVQPVGRDMPSTGKEMQQQKTTPSGTEKKKRQKKASSKEQAAERYMMTQMGSYGYGSYWNGMQPWMQGYIDPYGNPLPYTAYGMNSYGLPYPYDQGYMMPPRG